MTITGRSAPLAAAAAADAVRRILEREGRRAQVTVNFVGPVRMRRLNARWKGHDRPTDVLAFTLRVPGVGMVGDVYICRAVALREANARGIRPRNELLRLVVHGTLHVLGYDHPEHEARMTSPMWRRQERYLAWLS